jgi:FixJ family two-component response regulator
MNEHDGVVYVVDDDPSMRRSVSNLLRSAGLRVQPFASAQEYLRGTTGEGPACLVLDVRLPGLTGLELQRELAASPTAIPIVFISGHADVPMAVQALKAGAIEFLTKPFRDDDLLDAIRRGLALDAHSRQTQADLGALRRNLEQLTRRERDVLMRVIAGDLNKQIATELGISEATVKAHRGQVMQKMQAGSLAELVRNCIALGLISDHK